MITPPEASNPPPPPDTIDLPEDEREQEVCDEIDKLVDEAKRAAADPPKPTSTRKRTPRGPGCASCGPVNRNVDPDVMRRAKRLAKGRSRSLGFLGSDER